MLLERRDVLKLVLGSAALSQGWAITKACAQNVPEISSVGTAPAFLKNSLVTLGVDGERFPGVLFGKNGVANEYGIDNCSVLNELDMTTGAVKQTVIPVSKPHGALRLGNGNLVITAHHTKTSAVVDRNHRLVKLLEAPEGYLYGGHSALIPEKNIVIICLRHDKAKTIADTGLLMVYDAKDFTFLGQYNSHGILPHEIRLLSDRDEFVLTHYGDIIGADPDGLEFNILEPKLSVLNSGDFSKKREYIQPIDGIYTHMDIGRSHNVYAISNQYVNYANKSPVEVQSTLEKHNISYNYIQPRMGKDRARIPVPSGVIRVNAVTGDREEFLSSENPFLRSQSVAAHPGTGRIFATYLYSNQLVVIDEPTKKVIVKSGRDYGFEMVRGVTNIPGSDYVAISDKDRGVAIIDAATLEKVKEFDIEHLTSVHLFAT